jgi:hypothetical protein
VVSWGPPTILTCIVKGSVFEWNYALARFMASGVGGGTLVVPVANVPAIVAAVPYGFVQPASSCQQWFGGKKWCGAVAIIFERGRLVVQSMQVASSVVAYLGCGDRENFDGGGVHVKQCGAGWSGEFWW